MKLRVIILVATVLMGAGFLSGANDYFAHLDKLISEHDTRIASKKSAIEKIKKTLPAPSSDPAVLSKEYDINSSLYREYLEFQNDSAQKYVRRTSPSPPTLTTTADS